MSDSTRAVPFRTVPKTPQLDSRRWLALPVVLTAAFLAVLDFFIVNVAVPSIRAGLNADFAEIEFVIAAYGVAYALGLITGGRLGDIYGRKKMFMLGMAGFTLASVLCGLAIGPAMLIYSRIFQGVMAAVMVPQGLSIIQVSYSAHEKHIVFGSFGAAMGIASILGQVLGGVLIQANLFGLSWRPIFLVNFPIGVCAILAAAFFLPESRSEKKIRLDLAGVMLVSVALFLLMLPLVEGREAGWPPWSFVSLLASIPVMATFIVHQRWKSKRHGYSLVELSLFKNRSYVTGLLIALFFFSGLSSFFLTLTICLQSGLGFSPLAAGLSFTPFAVGFFISSSSSAALAPKMGSRIMNLGTLMMATGAAMLIVTLSKHTGDLNGYELVPALLIYGCGQGFTIPPFFNTVLSEVRPSEAGSASGVLSTLQQLAGSIGVAVIGLVFFGTLGLHPERADYVHALSYSLACNITLLMITCALVLFLPKKISSKTVELPLPEAF